MASLHELLSEEGFEHQRSLKSRKKVKFKDRRVQDESITLPIYMCHDRRSFDSSSKQRGEKASSLNGSSVFSSRRRGSDSERSNTKSIAEDISRKDAPAIDDAAVKTVISILTGYVGQYLRDKNFRETIREKCYSCFVKRKKYSSDNGIFANMELGIQSIERLVESQEINMKSLKNSIRLLKIVASLNSKTSRDGSTCGTPNSYLSACAQLYLSIVYKIAKNDRNSAKHILQVFCDSPFLARTHLLPELWEHFFLPHLLHLKIWYTKELEFLPNSEYVDKETKIKALNKLYNNQLDFGTIQFASYYKEWLKVGAPAPTVPSVPLPSRISHARSRRRSSDSSTSFNSINNKSLYQAVFGHIKEEEKFCIVEEDIKHCSHVEERAMDQQWSSSRSYRKPKVELWPENHKSDYFRFLACRSGPTEGCLLEENYMPKNAIIKNAENIHLSPSNDLVRAISAISSLGSLIDCEMAIRVVSKVWLDSQGDPIIEDLLSQVPVMEGIMEVLFVSNDDEILELAISILAELATKREMNAKILLNSDPHLDVFLRLLRSNNLFLKAAALLYLVKPKAKQMISTEWIPLVLRVLEFGDQTQTLFTVRCIPQVAAHYLLDQLLMGFHEDKNLENARQIISLGGLSLLVRRMDLGDTCEKSKAASVLHCCIQADGSCRHYLSKNLKKDDIISLLVLGKQMNSHGLALVLLTELLCLSRRNQREEFLSGLIKGWDCLNTMHILLLYLQKARPDERPIVAVILLQLDLMGDPLECSVYREEVVDAMVKALDCQVFNGIVQEQSAKALLIFGGQFSYNGEPVVEKWLLRKAGFDEKSEDSFCGKDICIDGYLHLNQEDKTMEIWQRKAAMVLLTVGNTRLLGALSDSMANGIPCLARASLVTVCWMSCGLHSLGDTHLKFAACSVLMPQLVESLNHDRPLEERILASFSLLSLIKGTDYFSKPSPANNELLSRLSKLSQVTWTAKELISIMTSIQQED
ncbi:putative E3 ubiquitin-protein ligase [Forsythia ovata]|uniref:E3 ubiquitin-protein ligase n=1 Tax=Forsythia ovata TaxID=205694 RepID=A0ABD1S016_9LAMI